MGAVSGSIVWKNNRHYLEEPDHQDQEIPSRMFATFYRTVLAHMQSSHSARVDLEKVKRLSRYYKKDQRAAIEKAVDILFRVTYQKRLAEMQKDMVGTSNFAVLLSMNYRQSIFNTLSNLPDWDNSYFNNDPFVLHLTGSFNEWKEKNPHISQLKLICQGDNENPYETILRQITQHQVRESSEGDDAATNSAGIVADVKEFIQQDEYLKGVYLNSQWLDARIPKYIEEIQSHASSSPVIPRPEDLRKGEEMLHLLGFLSAEESPIDVDLIGNANSGGAVACQELPVQQPPSKKRLASQVEEPKEVKKIRLGRDLGKVSALEYLLDLYKDSDHLSYEEIAEDYVDYCFWKRVELIPLNLKKEFLKVLDELKKNKTVNSGNKAPLDNLNMKINALIETILWNEMTVMQPELNDVDPIYIPPRFRAKECFIQRVILANSTGKGKFPHAYQVYQVLHRDHLKPVFFNYNDTSVASIMDKMKDHKTI